ncbi:MAG: hypothetical protein JXO22_01150 [Phycisphaerae bacterium]|nr:hypothetical protein [Phycisphaerae bacterium]
MMPARRYLLAAVLLGGGFVAPLSAEITAISGLAKASVTEVVGGVSGAVDEDILAYPDITTNLPLQVVAQLVAVDDDAAASAAGQFADPLTLDQANPEEFAVSLALSSAAAETRYTADVWLSESRTVTMHPSEVGNNAAGAQVTLIGTLFVDAALAIFGVDSTQDLTGAGIELRIRVFKTPLAEDGEDDPNRPFTAGEAVFDGTVELVGGTGGAAIVNPIGDFPGSQLFFANLSALVPEFGAVNVLAIPAIEIDYNYAVTVEETFELTSVFEVTAKCLPDGTAVTAILGTPTEALVDVLGVTQGEMAAKEIQSLLLRERETPSGDPVVAGDEALATDDDQTDTATGFCFPVAVAMLLTLTSLSIAASPLMRRRR